MNLFFGKISTKYDTNQISEGYYEAPLGSSWLGALAPGDYVYLIGGNKIQFWQARAWATVDGKNRMVFEILSADLGIKTNQLLSLNFLIINKALLVLTSRSSRIAFHSLKYNRDLNIEDLKNPQFYQNENLYRKIVITQKELLEESSQDIQLYFDNGRLHIVDASFFDPAVIAQFRDNSKFIGKGSKNKDSTILKITSNNTNNAIFNSAELGLRAFYDAFFCEYQEKEIDTMDASDEEDDSNFDSVFIDKVAGLLQYKKQIILQGPPGTGKTRLARDTAAAIIGVKEYSDIPKVISNEIITSIIEPDTSIRTAIGGAEYKVLEILPDRIRSEKENGTIDETLLRNIGLAYNNKLWDKPTDNNNDRRANAFAKYIFNHFNNVENWTDNDQCKVIQFHPSYTYEDFVRGIVAESKGAKIEYKNVNKILGLFAQKALMNFKNSEKIPEVISKEIWVETQYKKFKELLELDLQKSKAVFIKDGTIPKIIAIEDDAVRINRYSNEEEEFPVKDSDIIYGYIGLYLTSTQIKIKENNILSKSARSGMYYLYQNLIEKFKKYLQDNNLSFAPEKNIKKLELKNYILIIDEINRANLSSVLGELIYALEYRGEEVSSMYEVDGSNKLILPPNLYIIGTMNTADRSVGHIDYAIRRRFAFVDVLPQDLSDDRTIKFHSQLFRKVSGFFISNYDEYIVDNTVGLQPSKTLSPEFSPKDIWLGHSYFIQTRSSESGTEVLYPQDFSIRLEYEIKPILLEYLKDGILIDDEAKSLEKTIRTLQIMD